MFHKLAGLLLIASAWIFGPVGLDRLEAGQITTIAIGGLILLGIGDITAKLRTEKGADDPKDGTECNG